MPGSLPALVGPDHRCESCDVGYADWELDEALGHVRPLPDLLERMVRDVPAERLAARAMDGVWSPAEYVCHLRDVFMTYTLRVHRTRTEDVPTLDPMFNDLRAQRFDYQHADVGAVLPQVRRAVAGLLAEVELIGSDGWDRVAERLPGERRDARWLVRQAAHEGIHHVADIRDQLAASRRSGHPGIS